MGTKMKGLLKGLRYISQIFDEEKEPEMQIGFPTDVKHVAHIGWDGPSVHSPSWMNEFKTTPDFSTTPLGLGVGGDHHAIQNPKVKWGSEDSSQSEIRVLDSPIRDMPELPRSSRRQSPVESPIREKSEKSKNSRRQHSEAGSSDSKKDPSNGVRLNRQLQYSSLTAGSESPSHNLPNIPKKSRRKKSKDSSIGGSTRSSRSKGSNNNNISSTYEAPFSDPGPGPGPNSTNNEHYQTSTLQAYEEREKNLGVIGIS